MFEQKFSFFVQNFDLRPTLGFFNKTSIFEQKYEIDENFWLKIWFFRKFFLTRLFFVQTSSSDFFGQNFDFWPKFWFLIKISICDQIFDFWPNFRFLAKISIFDQNFNFWTKLRFLQKLRILSRLILGVRVPNKYMSLCQKWFRKFVRHALRGLWINNIAFFFEETAPKNFFSKNYFFSYIKITKCQIMIDSIVMFII